MSIIKRFGLRALLPLANLLAFVSLAVRGASPQLVTFSLQATTNVPWTIHNPFFPLLSAPRLVAVAINAPAYFLATSILAAGRISDLNFAKWVLPVMGPFVVLVWHLMGRWFDRQLGLLPPFTHPKYWSGILRAAAFVLGLLTIGSMYRVFYFVRGGIAGWHGETPFFAALAYGSAAWLFVWDVMVLTAIKRLHRVKSPSIEKMWL